jgi:hypothetical protein
MNEEQDSASSRFSEERKEESKTASRRIGELPDVLFIGGWGRSGSTLLSLLLHHPPDLVAVGEVREIWLRGCLENRLCGCGVSFAECPFWTKVGLAAFGGWDHVDARRAAQLRDHLDRPWMAPMLSSPRLAIGTRGAEIAEYGDLLRRLYRGVRAASGATTVIDSSKLATHAMLLVAADIETRTVHLVRDSRGVVHSWKKQVGRPDGRETDLMFRYNVAGACLRYVVYNGLTGTLRRTMPYQRLRYEDLVADPRRALAWILPSGTTVPNEIESAGFTPQQQHTVDGNPIRLATSPMRIQVDDAWRDAMPRREQMLILALTSPLLVKYGYVGRRRSVKRQ